MTAMRNTVESIFGLFKVGSGPSSSHSIGGGALMDDHGAVGKTEFVSYPSQHMREVLAHCETEAIPFWQYVAAHERDPWPRLEVIWQAMQASVQAGSSGVFQVRTSS